MTGYSKGGFNLGGKAATVYQTATPIVPTDATQIGPFSGLYVGVSGDVTVVLRNDDGTHPVTFKSCPVGILPVAVQGVNATGTAATNILGLA